MDKSQYADLIVQAEKALEGVTEGEWLYRPNRHDDWGVVKVGDFHLCQIRDPNCYTTDQLNEARANKIDPWEANARFIAFTRAWVPAAAAAIRELAAQMDAVDVAIANKGGTIHAPTQWAYDQACEALAKQRARAEAAEARVAELTAERDAERERCAKVAQDRYLSWGDGSGVECDATACLDIAAAIRKGAET